MALEFAEIVAELVQAVCGRGELEGGRDGLMDLFCSPAAHRFDRRAGRLPVSG